jgi:GNAT superfamily N-acetyltransferase
VEPVLVDPHPSQAALEAFWTAVWGQPPRSSMKQVLARSLVHVAQYHSGQLIGFVNVAWDGGEHAFLLDTGVHPDHRHRGVATRLVKRAVDEARVRGVRWVHVDYEPRLAGLYRGCGFRHTEAGLVDLQPS